MVAQNLSLENIFVPIVSYIWRMKESTLMFGKQSEQRSYLQLNLFSLAKLSYILFSHDCVGVSLENELLRILERKWKLISYNILAG